MQDKVVVDKLVYNLLWAQCVFSIVAAIAMEIY
jgi:hypothetical protein